MVQILAPRALRPPVMVLTAYGRLNQRAAALSPSFAHRTSACDADVATAGCASVCKVARHRELATRRNVFWAAFREDMGSEKCFMTQ